MKTFTMNYENTQTFYRRFLLGYFFGFLRLVSARKLMVHNV